MVYKGSLMTIGSGVDFLIAFAKSVLDFTRGTLSGLERVYPAQELDHYIDKISDGLLKWHQPTYANESEGYFVCQNFCAAAHYIRDAMPSYFGYTSTAYLKRAEQCATNLLSQIRPKTESSITVECVKKALDYLNQTYQFSTRVFNESTVTISILDFFNPSYNSIWFQRLAHEYNRPGDYIHLFCCDPTREATPEFAFFRELSRALLYHYDMKFEVMPQSINDIFRFTGKPSFTARPPRRESIIDFLASGLMLGSPFESQIIPSLKKDAHYFPAYQKIVQTMLSDLR